MSKTPPEPVTTYSKMRKSSRASAFREVLDCGSPPRPAIASARRWLPLWNGAARHFVFGKGLLAALLVALSIHLTSNCRAEEPAESSAAETPVVQTKVIDYEKSLRDQVAAMARTETILKRETSGPSAFTLMEIAIVGVLVWRLFASQIGAFLAKRFDPWAPVDRAGRASPDSRADEESFAAFAASLKTRPAAVPTPVITSSASPIRQTREEQTKPDPLKTFFRNAPEEIGTLRKLFGRIGWCNDEAGRRQVLEEILTRVQSFKSLADLPEIRPAWQVVATMEGLLNRLVSKPANLTPSCLRTAVSGLDLLTDLCVPGVRASLVTDPPVRLLAVDDDSISRLAVSSALKQVFTQPDMAVDGESALALAAKEKFDMIFLDVEMPGMNGFELCAKIRQIPENAQAPVVFVTSHSDFNSRSQLPLTGAQDLIAKPFMSFEVALKALTFILRGRLANAGQAVVTNAESSPRPNSTAPETKATQQQGELSWGSQVAATG